MNAFRSPAILLTCIVSLGIATPARADKASGGLEVYWTDVEGGAATLIVTPDDETVLIDSGNPGQRDPGRIAHTILEVAHRTKIDHYITTHFHVDHFGGAAELSTKVPFGVIYDNGIPDHDPDGGNGERFAGMIKPYAEIKADKRVVIQPNMPIPLRQGARSKAKLSLTCIAAKDKITDAGLKGPVNPDCSTSKEKPADTSDNKNSVVTILKFGSFTMFIGGDLTWNTEARLVCPVNLIGKVDVFQVDHHGLDISNNPLLVHALSPTISVMSNGTRKGCGADTFATLKSTPSIQAMYQIHKNIRQDIQNNAPDETIANLEEKCAGNHIALSVKPDGTQYTVSIPANKYERTFKSKK